MTDRIPTAPVAAWLDPEQDPPPRAKKILLLTRYGVAVLGPWGSDCVAWSPLPKIPQHIKERMYATNTTDANGCALVEHRRPGSGSQEPSGLDTGCAQAR